MSGTFDTLTAARELEAAGMDRKQAEAVAGAIRKGQGQLVTIADLSAVETRLTAKLETLETRLTAKLETLDTRITATRDSVSATLYRALWIQAAGVIATITVLAGISIGLATLWTGQ